MAHRRAAVTHLRVARLYETLGKPEDAKREREKAASDLAGAEVDRRRQLH
jgi:hypothetical protein